MVTYRLMAKNELNNKKIILEGHRLAEIDRFIYNSFSNEFEIARYFEMDNSKFYITYVYHNDPKILDLILKDNNFYFASLLRNSHANVVDTSSTSFRKFIDEFIGSTTNEQLKYLFENKYIDKYTYNNLMEMKNNNKNGFDHARDMAEWFSYLKQDLKRYINFRKLYSGIIAYNNYSTKIINLDDKVQAKTSDEFVNELFNNGGYDELYSRFDLDDLRNIDGIEELKIDGIGKKNRL